jgi:hypothetical protein
VEGRRLQMDNMLTPLTVREPWHEIEMVARRMEMLGQVTASIVPFSQRLGLWPYRYCGVSLGLMYLHLDTLPSQPLSTNEPLSSHTCEAQ